MPVMKSLFSGVVMVTWALNFSSLLTSYSEAPLEGGRERDGKKAIRICFSSLARHAPLLTPWRLAQRPPLKAAAPT